ncbi:hypothetical protein [Paenibacillus sp. MBLB4367]|uniref:hypothetical protein n=1 Tax=Paenibacillus sp. MBLB4367 TaxID=3384767 RepID=UPI0039081882
MFDGDAVCRVYDRNWSMLREAKALTGPPVLRSSHQVVSFGCRFEGGAKPSVAAKFFTRGEPERVG